MLYFNIIATWLYRPIPELNAAEKELLALLRREVADDKKFSDGKVRLTFTPRNLRSISEKIKVGNKICFVSKT